MEICRNFLTKVLSLNRDAGISIRKHVFLWFCITITICSYLSCKVEKSGVGKLPTEWWVSTAKDNSSPGGTSKWQVINTSFGFHVNDIRLGDFDGDSKTDVFTSWDHKWHVSIAKDGNSLGATGSWVVINNSDVLVYDILLGDFDGDKKADVFTSGGGIWRVSLALNSASLGGTGSWTVINSSNVPVSDIRLGDFDRDGKTDVFTAGGGKWRVSLAKDSSSLGATGGWQEINTSDVPLSYIKLADFDGDRKSDAFTWLDGKWRISIAKTANSLGATSEWQDINTSDVIEKDILLGDFDRDRKADVFTTWKGKWRISTAKTSSSFGGTGPWQVINSSDIEVSTLLVGDFDADRKADIFTTR